MGLWLRWRVQADVLDRANAAMERLGRELYRVKWPENECFGWVSGVV